MTADVVTERWASNHAGTWRARARTAALKRPILGRRDRVHDLEAVRCGPRDGGYRCAVSSNAPRPIIETSPILANVFSEPPPAGLQGAGGLPADERLVAGAIVATDGAQLTKALAGEVLASV